MASNNSSVTTVKSEMKSSSAQENLSENSGVVRQQLSATGMSVGNDFAPSTPVESASPTNKNGSDVLAESSGASSVAQISQGQSLQFVQRISNLPVSICAASVRDAAMEFVIVEKSVSVLKLPVVVATSTASFLCSPFATLCDGPVRGADWVLCKGLDIVEAVFPCIAVPPNQMYAATKSCAANCVCCKLATCTASTLTSAANKLRDSCYQKN